MEKMPYQYRSLQHHDSIRILTLNPGQQHEPLTGALEAVSVNHAGIFEAVSYVWAEPGPSNRAYEILIINDENSEGLLKLSGGSIFAALCQLRFPDRWRRIWADQCCINQKDPAERSQQLHFMNRIFQDAVHVLVWLGLDTKKEALSAFGLVQELDKALGGQSVDDTFHYPDTVDLERQVENSQTTLQALTERAWVSVAKVLSLLGPERNSDTESANSSNADGSHRKLGPGHQQPSVGVTPRLPGIHWPGCVSD